jgi:hypothetical protein
VQLPPPVLTVTLPTLDSSDQFLGHSQPQPIGFHYTSDLGVDLTRVHLSVDGTDVPLCTSLPPGHPADALCLEVASDEAGATVTFATDGAHALVASVADTAGQTSSKSFSITEDWHAPQVSFACRAAGCPSGTWNETADPLFTLTIQHPDYNTSDPSTWYYSGIARVLVQVDPGTANEQDLTPVLGPDSGGSLFSTDVVLSGLADGMHFVIATVTDNAGNQGAGEYSFTVDSSVPQVVSVTPGGPLLAPINLRAEQQQVKVDYTDPGEPGAALTVSVTDNGQAISPSLQSAFQGGPGELSELAGAVRFPEGPHTLTATVTTRAGTSSAPVSVTFLIDHTPPVAQGLTFVFLPDHLHASVSLGCSDTGTCCRAGWLMRA